MNPDKEDRPVTPACPHCGSKHDVELSNEESIHYDESRPDAFRVWSATCRRCGWRFAYAEDEDE